MSHPDADRWNARYREARSSDYQSPRPFLTEHLDLLPDRGLALDVAMGAGKNTRALLDRGLSVIGVDISAAAVLQAHAHFPQAHLVVADVASFHLPDAYFDVILNFYFLQRELWHDYRRAIKPGGLLVYETLTEAMLASKPDLNAAYLLREGELLHAFHDWHILVYQEGCVASGSGYEKCVASMIARAPE